MFPRVRGLLYLHLHSKVILSTSFHRLDISVPRFFIFKSKNYKRLLRSWTGKLKKSFLMKTKKMFLVALLMGATVVNAKVWRVNPNTRYDADFHTVQEAVDTAIVVDGDTLLCEAGFYENGAIINKRLTLIGVGYGMDENDNGVIPSEFNKEITICHDSVVIEGIVGSINTSTTTVTTTTPTHCIIERCFSYSIKGGNNAIIKNCFVSNNITAGSNAIVIGNIAYEKISTGSNSTIKNNTVINGYINATNSVIKDNIALYGISNIETNVVTHNIFSQTDTIVGFENNVYGAKSLGLFGRSTLSSTNPRQYQIIESDEFHAKTSSSTGGECGAFGGSAPFRLGMRPFGMPYLYDVNVPSVVTGDLLNINFKVGVQNE